MKHILPAVSLSFLGAFSFGCGDAQSVEDDEKRNSSSGGSATGASGGASSDDASGGAPSLLETTGGAASGGQETGAGGTTIAEPDPCEAKEGSLVAELISLTVSNAAGGEPRKGEGLVFEITLRNVGEGVGDISVMPRLKSHRFSDYDDVPAGTASGTLCEGESVFTLEVGPFLDDEERGKHYALGSGDYSVTGLELSGQQERVPSDVDFNIATSGALLVPVIYATTPTARGALRSFRAASTKRWAWNIIFDSFPAFLGRAQRVTAGVRTPPISGKRTSVWLKPGRLNSR